jgi:acetylornithine deacetylase/succinyl-diaminopimelate desuccinylase-like protein
MRAISRRPPDRAAAERLAKTPRYNALLRTTCVATRIEGGHANNALPQTARANVNCRILPGHSPEEVRQALIRVVADGKLTVRYEEETHDVADRAPAKKGFAPNLPPAALMRTIEKVAAELWPGAPVVPVMDTGASDSVHTVNAGMPSYGVNGIAIDEDDVRAHGKDERVPAASFYEGVVFHYRLLKALTSDPGVR